MAKIVLIRISVKYFLHIGNRNQKARYIMNASQLRNADDKTYLEVTVSNSLKPNEYNTKFLLMFLDIAMTYFFLTYLVFVMLELVPLLVPLITVIEVLQFR